MSSAPRNSLVAVLFAALLSLAACGLGRDSSEIGTVSDIAELAEKSTYLETAYLIVKGELPDEHELSEGGLGIAIVSTPAGVMTDREARRVGQGGEVLCVVA